MLERGVEGAFSEPDLLSTGSPDDDDFAAKIHAKLQLKQSSERLQHAYNLRFIHRHAHESQQDLPDSFFQLEDAAVIPVSRRQTATNAIQLTADNVVGEVLKRRKRLSHKLASAPLKRKTSTDTLATILDEPEDLVESPDNQSLQEQPVASTSKQQLDLSEALTKQTRKDKAKQHSKLRATISKYKFKRGNEEAFQQALAEVKAQVDKDEDLYGLDVLFECQRGFISFGIPKFSSAALLNFDPTPWTFADMSACPFTPVTFPLPSPDWHWLYPQWMIDMTGDVDQEGWAYSFSFITKGWRATSKTWRSFVRRRRWVRKRVKRNLATTSIAPHLSKRRASIIVPDEIADLRNSEFADREIPGNEYDVAKVATFDGELTPFSAHQLLPISAARRAELLNWEGKLDAGNPFISWKKLREEGMSYVGDVDKTSSMADLQRVWKTAVTHINYHRIQRVLSACKVDRERLDLWYHWLGVQDLLDRDHPAPDVEDVWDVLESHLDGSLRAFMYQYTRMELFRLLCSIHNTSDSHHRYSSNDKDCHASFPASIDPTQQQSASKLLNVSKSPASRFLPRIEFYGLLERMSN